MSIKTNILKISFFSLVGFFLLNSCTQSDNSEYKGVEKVFQFQLSDVELLEGPFLDGFEVNTQYLLSLDPDRFLYSFRKNAEIHSMIYGYGGWEADDIEVRGHTMGHYLSALAKSYAVSGHDEFLRRGNYTVNELAKVQEALNSNGYLMAVPETFFDRLESGDYVWAPYYVFHKILAGLIDQYTYAGNSQALGVAIEMAEWVYYRTSKLSEEQIQMTLETEFGGMVESFAQLFKLTKDEKYLELARRFDHQAVTVPLSKNIDALLGKHANTQLPKITGAAMMYEATGNHYFKKIAQNGYNLIEGVRTYSFGGFSNYEFFLRPPNFLSDQLSVETAETCCTHNLMKLNHHLFTWDPNPSYGDYYERALINHIYASHDRTTGMFMYYMSQRPGHWKTWSTPDSSFWCCVGSGMENPTDYGRSVYYHTTDELYVNLFMASRLSWSEKGVTLTQNTRFPLEEGTKLSLNLDKPTTFTLKLRVPWWTYSGFIVEVNGQRVSGNDLPSSWFVIEREWRDGDEIKVSFPFTVHIERMPDDPSMFSIFNGPVVLVADLGDANLTDEQRYIHNQRGMFRHRGEEIEIPVFSPNNKPVSEWIEKVDGEELLFKTSGTGQPGDFYLKPYFDINKERYQIYFKDIDYRLSPAPWNFE